MGKVQKLSNPERNNQSFRKDTNVYASTLVSSNLGTPELPALSIINETDV
jgi:hypothetical protein